MSGRSSSKQNFWTTFPGIVSAIAGLLTAVAAVLAVVLSPGPEPDPAPDPKPVPLTHAQWVREAGKVCSQMNRDAQSIALPSDPNDPAQEAQYARKFALALSRAAQGLDDLEAPESDQSRASEATRTLNSASTHWQRAAAAYDLWAEDPEGAMAMLDDAMQAAERNLRRTGEIFLSLGVEGCSGSTT